MFTPLRFLQITTIAAVIYATAAIIDGLSDAIDISRQLSGAIQASLGVGFILSGGACLLERYCRGIAKQLAEAHEEREEFRRRFDALAASIAEHEQHRLEAEVTAAAHRVNGRLSIVEKT